MSGIILVLNAGSSTIKCALYKLPADALPVEIPTAEWHAACEGTSLRVTTASGARNDVELTSTDPEAAIPVVLRTLREGPTAVLQESESPAIVGHRVVHGGKAYTGPTLITNAAKAEITRLIPLAPAHNPPALAGIEAAEATFGGVPQLAVFDTAFHQTIPEAAAVYPVPYAWTQRGLRRYGFHGISHEYAARRAAELLGRELSSVRLVTCHLGNGCSLAAVRNGQSVDTTMGFTPLEGLMMGTRSGSVDPGLLLYLMNQEGYTADDLTRALNNGSGLLGVSGVSSDMREVSAVAAEQPQAQLALDVYVHRVISYVGAMITSLGGLDALVFTGGVGENSALIRSRVCDAFAFLGLKLDRNKNASLSPDTDVASEGSPVRVFVVRAQENWAIARACWATLRAHQAD